MSKHLLPLIAACLPLVASSACQAQPSASSPLPQQAAPAQAVPAATPRIQLPTDSGKSGRIQCVRWPCPGDPLDSPTGHVVRKLYRQFPQFYAEPEPARVLLSDGLFVLLQKEAACMDENGMCAIEADPWTAAQDGDHGDPLHYRHLSRQKDDDGNEVAASVELCCQFTLGGASEQRCVVLKLVRGPRTPWKVDDLVSPDGQSLRETLQGYPYPP